MGNAFGSSIAQERDGGTISYTPKGKHSLTIIFLHGLGDTAEGWADRGKTWCKQLPETRVVLPTAPAQAVTINGGMKMPAWYDIVGLGEQAALTAPGLDVGQKVILDVYEKELKRLNGDASRIILGGFSMGGAIALFTALQQPKLGGIVLLSSYIVTPQNVDWTILDKETPILQCHGTEDKKVPFSGAKKTHQMIRVAKFKNTEFKSYENLGHFVCDLEMKSVAKWLGQRAMT